MRRAKNGRLFSRKRPQGARKRALPRSFQERGRKKPARMESSIEASLNGGVRAKQAGCVAVPFIYEKDATRTITLASLARLLAGSAGSAAGGMAAGGPRSIGPPWNGLLLTLVWRAAAQRQSQTAHGNCLGFSGSSTVNRSPSNRDGGGAREIPSRQPDRQRRAGATRTRRTKLGLDPVLTPLSCCRSSPRQGVLISQRNALPTTKGARPIIAG